MADLLGFLGKRIKGAVAQVNPFDGGADYNSVVNAPAPRPVVPQNYVERMDVQAARQQPAPQAPQRNPIQQFGDFAGNVNKQVYGNPLGTTLKFVQSLPKAAQQFNEGVGGNVQAMLHAPGRGIKSLGLDVRGQQSYTPQNIFEQGIYGKQPVVNSQIRGQQDLNGIGGMFGNPNLGNNAGGLLQRAVGTVENLVDAVPAGVAVKKGAENLAYAGITKPHNLTEAEIVGAQRVAQARSGLISTQQVTPQDVYAYNSATKKLGGNIGTPEGHQAVVDALNAQRNYETQIAQRNQFLAEKAQQANTFAQEHLLPAGSTKKVIGADGTSPMAKSDQIKQQLDTMSNSPEFQNFYKGGKISGKSWNEYQRLSGEYRQLLDSESGNATPKAPVVEPTNPERLSGPVADTPKNPIQGSKPLLQSQEPKIPTETAGAQSVAQDGLSLPNDSKLNIKPETAQKLQGIGKLSETQQRILNGENPDTVYGKINVTKDRSGGGKVPVDNRSTATDLPVIDTKRVSTLDKITRSTRSIIERQGEHGKQLANDLQAWRDTEELHQAAIIKQLPNVFKLKGKDFENFVEATQGRAKPNNTLVEKAISEWQNTHPQIRQKGLDVGMEIGDLGKKYYPHFIDYERVFKDKNTYNQAINHLVKTGQAKSQEEAIKLLSYARDVSRNRTVGNLEASRTIDLPFYDKTPNSLKNYIQSATRRIAQVQTFGAKDEKALQLISKAGQQGYDTEAMKNAYDVAVGAKKYNPLTEKTSNNLRRFSTTTRLGLGALTNASQSVNTGIVTGHLRTMGAMLKQLDPKTRSFVADTGTISDAVLNDIRQSGAGLEHFKGQNILSKGVDKITAPGFGAVEKFNRSVASVAGRDYALRLAQKGDEATLRRLGVTGEIKNNTLTMPQQIQAARKVVEKTQFKVDPQDLPGWVDSPGGKLVAQFRTFSYAQGKFVSNEILKPMKQGNFKPAARLLAALPLGYALYETRRAIDGRPQETDPTKLAVNVLGKVGGAGLAFDIYNGINPLGSKYLPPDRRTSMAVGTFLGPTAGTATNLVGSLSEAIQKKNIPKANPDLTGKVGMKSGSGDTAGYNDLTSLSRFGLQQLPVVGTPLANRVLPYKKQAEADTGTTKPSPDPITQLLNKLTGGTPANAATATLPLMSDSEKTAARTEALGGLPNAQKFSAMTETNLKDLAKTDQEAKAYYDRKQQIDKVLNYAPKTVNPQVSSDSQNFLVRHDRLSETGRKAAMSKENDYEYKLAQAKYEEDKANGNISDLQDIKRQDELQKAKVGADFEKKTRDLYGMSKADVYKYVSNHKDGKALVDQLLAYGDALVNSDVETKNKFRDKNGNVSLSEKDTVKGKKAASGRASAKKSAKTALSALTSASDTVNGLKIPHTTGSTAKFASKLPTPPQLKKSSLRKYAVKSATINSSKASSKKA